jgi:hypothetical protein
MLRNYPLDHPFEHLIKTSKRKTDENMDTSMNPTRMRFRVKPTSARIPIPYDPEENLDTKQICLNV